MWGLAIRYCLAPFIFFMFVWAALVAMGNVAESIFILSTILYFVLFFIGPPLFANAAYYRHCRNEIARVQRTGKNQQEQLVELEGTGGTSRVVPVVVGLGTITFLGIVATISMHAFEDYKVRTSVVEAHILGQSACETVSNYYAQNKAIPATLEEAGFMPLSTTNIRAITMNANNGAIYVTMARPPNAGKSLVLVPAIGANSAITWNCESRDIAKRHLPPACRNGAS
jgi:hypothetical protein